MTLRLKPEAEQDLQDAVGWYEAQRPGLGAELWREIRVALGRIDERPNLYRRVNGEVRRALVRRFPYAIYYLSDGTDVAVYAVLHQRQEPSFLKDRLKKS